MQVKERVKRQHGTGLAETHSTEDPWSGLAHQPLPDSVRYVVVVNRTAPRDTIRFLVDTLQSKALHTSLLPSQRVPPHEDLILLVTATQSVLRDHAYSVYMPQQLSRQAPNDCHSRDNFTRPEQERILLHLLESIVQKERSTLVGLGDVTIYPGQSIIQIYHRERVILDYFPLHQADVVRQLKADWASPFVRDLDSVRNYFGEKIGFYFSFLNFYTSFLMYISVLCFTALWLGHLYLVNECVTVSICISLFVYLKMWKRASSRLACKWGTIEALELESARPSFRSKGTALHSDPVTGQAVTFYPIAKTWAKEYLISLPCVLLCLLISFEMMCLYFDAEIWAAELYNRDPSLVSTFVSYLPSVIYSLLVMLMNRSYRIFATRLNDYENHRTQISHENHWIVKLVLFEFVNNFMSLFYIAFYLKDISMLKWNLITMLTINQLVDNLLETVLPLSASYFSKRLSAASMKKSDWHEDTAQVEFEKELCDYEDTYYDYLELFVQYGYAFLFVSIFPLAPVIALINNLVEVRLDGIKLCVAMRKPHQRSAKSVSNAWMKSFEVISILVVISNVLVLSFVSSPVQELSSWLHLSSFEFMIYTEHVIFSIILLLWYIVPDMPKDVNLSLSRQKYRNIKEISNRQLPRSSTD